MPSNTIHEKFRPQKDGTFVVHREISQNSILWVQALHSDYLSSDPKEFAFGAEGVTIRLLSGAELDVKVLCDRGLDPGMLHVQLNH